MNVLAIGDVSGKVGLEFVVKKLSGIIRYYDIAFTVANAENTSGIGMKTEHAQALFKAGCDVLTLGNHTWGVKGTREYLDSTLHILRPINFAPQAPGRGWWVYETPFGDVCVVNLIGCLDMPNSNVYDNPFHKIDSILEQINTNIILVDFHAEATSEKYAMAYHLDGRVSALWGTHTHVQTSDCCVFKGGMGYITDVGMAGAVDSVIGMSAEYSVSRFLGNPPERFESASGPGKIEGAIFEIEPLSGKCLSVEAIRII